MIEFLQSLDILSEEEIADAMEHSTMRVLPKGAFFVREGSVCREVAFIQSGILRSYYTNDEADEITYCIMFAPSFMTAYSSLITGEPTVENIQAVTEAKLLILQKDYIEERSQESMNWLKLQKYLSEQEYLELEQRIISYQKDDARQRYRDLVERHPDYLQQIPLQYLASYLGISQRHLSRIRSEFAAF